MFLVSVYGGIQKVKLAKRKKNNGLPYVAVIVPFRNEAENLPGLIESLKSQTYPKSHLQIILVNDASTDNSRAIAVENAADNFLIIDASSTGQRAFKKKAIEEALRFAHGEIIITTDADCLHKPEWIETLVKYFDENTGVVSGPVTFDYGNSLFEKLQTLEFAGLVLTGAGLIGTGKPIIANAANFAYRKKAFDAVNGYADNKHLSSGDDEILMQKIANETAFEIKFAWDKKAIVKTKANKTASDFIQQRKRWASKGMYYFDKSVIALLGFIFLFYLSLVFLFAGGFFGFSFKWFVFLFTVKSLLELAILKQGANFLFEKKLLRLLPLAEAFQIPYIVFAAIGGAAGNYEWKSRKIKR